MLSLFELRWVRPDLNQRPRHLQCRALPTKLLTRATFGTALAISSLPLGIQDWPVRDEREQASSFSAFERVFLEGEQDIHALVRSLEEGGQFFGRERRFFPGSLHFNVLSIACFDDVHVHICV